MKLALPENWQPDQNPEVVEPAPAFTPGAADFAELADFPPIARDGVAESSAKSAGAYVQPAILPADSILAD